jgi:hypothetical protein
MRSRDISVSTAIAAVLAASLTLVACGPSLTRATAQEGPEPAVLRTYQVASEQQDEVYNALRLALGNNGENALGRVSRGPGGSLVVVAPERIQDGVQGIVDAGFEEAPPTDEASSRPIRVTYSIVAGRPLDSAAQPVTVRGRRFPRLDDVFAQIATAQGPTEFVVLEEIAVTSTNQVPARVWGRLANVDQTVSRRGDGIVASIEIQRNVPTSPVNRFESQVTLRVGQVLVLGQAGFQGNVREAFPDADARDTSATLYYIVSSDPA